MQDIFSSPGFLNFSVNNKKYLFHRQTLSIIQLPKEITSQHKEKINKIIKEVKSSTKDIAKPALRTIALNLTNNCNFACRYCFANHGNYGNPGIVMNISTARKAIKLLFKSVIEHNQKRAAIAFFGGEPLLEWSLIKKIVNFAKDNSPKNINLMFLITTNASLMDTKKIEFMKDNNFSVMVSIDGPEKENNKNRIRPNGEGTYNEIIDNIKKASKKLPLTFRATITNNNLDLVKIVDHFKNLGARMITFGLDNNHLNKESYNIIGNNYEKLRKKYHKDLTSGEIYEITNFSQILFQLLFKERKISHCNAGLSYLGVAADGLMYKCPRFTDISGHQFADISDLKKVEKKLNSFRQELRESAGERNSNCSQCPYVYLCGGLCHYDLFQKNKSVLDLIPEQCQLRKKIYYETIKLYASLSELIKRKYFCRVTDLDLKGGEIHV